MKLTADKLRVDAAAPADASNPPPAQFTIDQLAISPLNVRFNEVAIDAVEALRSQIVAEGLLQGLILHPAPQDAEWAQQDDGPPAQFGVLAGGRRYRAIRRAIDAGQLPADFPIQATVRDLPDGEILLLSLIENLNREDLLLFETCRAVARIAGEGLTVDQIAAKTGQRRRWVEQQLRLGQLAPPIFAAFIAGKLSTDQAMAYAATEDHALQEAAWAHFTGSLAYAHTANTIRAFFKVGDRELTRNLQFVGEAIYRGNGGRFELDLFAEGPDSMRGRIVDEQLLAKLTHEMFETARASARAAWGEADLRFQAEPPKMAHAHIADRELEVSPRRADWESARIPRGADPADFVGTIDVEQDGDWTARLWWKSRAAKAAFDRPAKSGAAAAAPAESFAAAQLRAGKAEGGAFERYTGYEAEARKIVRDEHGLTADGIDVVRGIRRDILRALLVSAGEEINGSAPRDYFTWSALRQALAGARENNTGARGLAMESHNMGEREPTELLIDQRKGQGATAAWGDAVQLLTGLPAFALEDEAAALRAYFAATEGEKRLAEAVLAGLALVRSANTPGWRAPPHDVLAEALGGAVSPGAPDAETQEAAGNLRRFWQPTAAFVGLFGKLARQAIAAPFIDEAARRQLAKAKDRDLTARVAEITADQPQWIHPLLAFTPTPTLEPTAATAPAELEPAG